MTILWLIEARTAPSGLGAHAAPVLAGNFPVRLFASLRSLAAICHVEKPEPPALLVVNVPSLGLDRAQARAALPASLANASILWLGDGAADDGLAWPAPDVTLVRAVRACLSATRPAPAESGLVYRYRGLVLDLEHHALRIDGEGKARGLTMKEARLLRHLMETPGRCVPREELQEKVWKGVSVSPRTVDSHISRLRRHLEPAGLEIRNVYGSGYALE